mmetsp:Transcript_14765/g.44340  ORF Transcript_14765/g.44340 Transcript_14765/m.44340 type:complete len:216 (-) Transcript_14765:2661-3308(-)
MESCPVPCTPNERTRSWQFPDLSSALRKPIQVETVSESFPTTSGHFAHTLADGGSWQVWALRRWTATVGWRSFRSSNMAWIWSPCTMSLVHRFSVSWAWALANMPCITSATRTNSFASWARSSGSLFRTSSSHLPTAWRRSRQRWRRGGSGTLATEGFWSRIAAATGALLISAATPSFFCSWTQRSMALAGLVPSEVASQSGAHSSRLAQSTVCV